MQIKFDDSFNWLAVLKDLAGGMEITENEQHRLIRLAGDWPTCACGQLCKNLPKIAGYGGVEIPADTILRVRGVEFVEQVGMLNWSGAIKTFRAIEERTTELLLAQEHADSRQD